MQIPLLGLPKQTTLRVLFLIRQPLPPLPQTAYNPVPHVLFKTSLSHACSFFLKVPTKTLAFTSICMIIMFLTFCKLCFDGSNGHKRGSYSILQTFLNKTAKYFLIYPEKSKCHSNLKNIETRSPLITGSFKSWLFLLNSCSEFSKLIC